MPTTNYIWDEANDSYLMETDEAGDTTAAYTNEPVHYGNLVSQQRNDQTNFYHFDGQHSTRALTDENENVTDTATYTAFGEMVAKTGSTENPFGFTGALGYYANPMTNDLYVRARTFQPRVGRWLRKDPLEFFDGMNSYTYVRNSPVSAIDPTGEALTVVDDTNLHFAYWVNLPDLAGTAGITTFCFKAIGECEVCAERWVLTNKDAIEHATNGPCHGAIFIPIFMPVGVGSWIPEITFRFQAIVALNRAFDPRGYGPFGKEGTVYHEQRHAMIAMEIIKREATRVELAKLFPTEVCVVGRTVEKCKADALAYQRDPRVRQEILKLLAPAGDHRRDDGQPTRKGQPPRRGKGEPNGIPYREAGLLNTTGWFCFSEEELAAAGRNR